LSSAREVMEHKTFKEALELLSAAHDKEVSALQTELSLLKTRIPKHAPPVMMITDTDVPTDTDLPEEDYSRQASEPPKDGATTASEIIRMKNSWTDAPPKFADSTKPTAMDEVELDLVKDLFKKCDKDNDNMLDFPEFASMMVELGKQTHKKYTASQIEKWFKRTDTDSSGRVDFDEFVIMQKKWAKLNRPVSRRVSATAADIGPISPISYQDVSHRPENKCLIDPAGSFRLTWDIAGMFLIAYDMITIPMLAFSPEDTVFTEFMGWLAMIFWTLDMACSVSTGIKAADGTVIMDRRAIVKLYLRTWFIIDCIVVIPDWTMTFIGFAGSGGNEDGQDVARMSRMLRAFRAVRIMRLLRLAKLKKLLNYIYDAIDSEHLFLIVQLVQLIFIILFLNHYVACIWYALGEIGRTGGSNNGLNWLQDSGQTPVYDTDLGWKYISSLHWSITQFTPAGMDVSAVNLMERLFSVAILFFSLVTISSVIGSVSAAMTQLRNLNGDKTKQFWLLRRYLKENKIDYYLRDRILRYAEIKSDAASKKTPMTKVALLNTLSDPLKQEVLTSLCAPTIVMHPFFSHLEEFMTKILRKICSDCVKVLNLADKDVGFRANEDAAAMYFLKSGQFDYTLSGQSTPRRPALGAQEWLAELALWAKWRHRGDLVATAASDILLLAPESFSKMMQLHPRSWHFARGYAHTVVKFMNSVDATEQTDFTYDDDISPFIVQNDVYDDNGGPLRASEKNESGGTSPTQVKVAAYEIPAPLPGQVLN